MWASVTSARTAHARTAGGAKAGDGRSAADLSWAAVSPPVAIAVVSWNTADLLDACLRSMLADVEADLAEVWVIDNGSTDGSPALVRDRHPWARLIVAERNLGFGPAVNRVAAQTTSRWIAPANADIQLTPGALRALVDAGEREPVVGVLGPRLLLPDSSTQPGVQPFPGVVTALLQNLPAHRLSRRLGERMALPGFWDPERPADVDWVTGAFLVVRRSAWNAIGGFDEQQWMYAEDTDLCWRAHRAGWRVRYEPAARVHHVHSVAAAKAFGDVDQRAVRMLRADHRWLRRRRGRLHAWGVVLVNMTLLALRVAVFGAVARMGVRTTEARLHASRRSLVLHRRGARALLSSE